MNERILSVVELGRMGYARALEIQREVHAKRIAGALGDTLLLVEHDPVLTLGRNADKSNIVASQNALCRLGIEVFEIERGGDVTYHGPGQQVGYPILNIRELGMSLHDYMRKLEETMIVALAEFGLKAHRIEELTGVFVDNAKVVAMGIAVRKWVTYHGFAFNVAPDLRHFDLIVPCGIRDHPVTSLAQLLGREVTPIDLREPLITAFLRVFEMTQR
jgi:lipoate-protein ligase B